MTDSRMPYFPPGLSPDPAPLALDGARDRAIRLLTDGYAYDVISEEEFEWRLGQMSHADSPHAIDALVADLMPAAAGASRALAPAFEPVGRVVGIMSETRKVGPWRVPQRLRVKAIMSDMKIDLRYAVLPPACTIDVTSIMANVTFIVPPGMIVDFDVSSFMSSARNDDRASAASVYVLPHVRIHGRAIMSEVRVKVRDVGR
jgi:cell wall-active antibiotic response 4TMS protein YvqF